MAAKGTSVLVKIKERNRPTSRWTYMRKAEIYVVTFLSLLATSCIHTIAPCTAERALTVGTQAMTAKYPEYEIYVKEYTVKYSDSQWWVLREEALYQRKPQEYPRVVLSVDACEVQKILWSK